MPDVPRHRVAAVARTARPPGRRNRRPGGVEPAQSGRFAADDRAVASPARQHALFALARALLSTLDPDEVARRFDAHVPGLIGGAAQVWLVDETDRLRRLGEPAETRSLEPVWREAIASGRPQ